MELVEEKEIVAAFRNDSWVQRMLSEASLQLEGETLKKILDFFSKDLMGPRFSESSFCVLGFTNGVVKIRFVDSEYMGYNYKRYFQLGFKLPIKKDALYLFTDTNNFYL